MNSGLERLQDVRWERWIVALLVVSAVAPFAQTFGFGYVYDDTFAIRSNPDLRGWGSVFRVWLHPYGGSEAPFFGLYRPVTMSLFALLWNLGGGWPIWFHVTAVAMHAIAAVLVWRLLSRGIDWVPAALAALWFCVHPVHVEAVANIANGSELLVAIFTCALALHVMRLSERDATPSMRQAVVAGALYLGAFLSKESGAMAPVLAVLCAWGWKRQAPLAANALRVEIRRWRPVAGAWLVAAVIVLVLRALVLGGPVSGESIGAPGIDHLTTPQRMWAMLSLGPTILGLLVWPTQVNPHYGPTAFPQPQATANWLAWVTLLTIFAAIAAAAWLAKRRERRPLVGLLWMVVAFLPASNLLVATGQILSERTLYVPSIGLAMLIGVVLLKTPEIARLKQPWLVAWPVIVAVVAFVVAIFAARTARWTGAWRDHPALFGRMVAADTSNYAGYWFQGVHAGRNGDMREALALLERAYTRYPRDLGLKLDYADALLDQGQSSRAAAVSRELMAYRTYRARPHAAATYLESLGRTYGPDSVLSAASRLMSQTPTPTAALFLGSAHEVKRDFTSAARVYQDALLRFPGDTALVGRLAALSRTR